VSGWFVFLCFCCLGVVGNSEGHTLVSINISLMLGVYCTSVCLSAEVGTVKHGISRSGFVHMFA